MSITAHGYRGFDLYIALGDSMSTDEYPYRDALARFANAHVHELRENLGPAALLYKNADEIFSDFRHRDLSSICPGIRFANLAKDNQNTVDLLDLIESEGILETTCAKHLDDGEGRILLTLTIGGNDLLAAFLRSIKIKEGQYDLDGAIEELRERFSRIVKAIDDRLDDYLLLVTDLYDPSDKTGRLPPNEELDQDFPVLLFYQFNRYIHENVLDLLDRARIKLAPVHEHFLGHGVSKIGTDQYWYWNTSPIEPGMIGASEIRRVWLETLGL